jgi:30S ribosomal protein S31
MIRLAFLSYSTSLKLYTIMGRGDIKTKKGKIANGSFGKSRPAKPAKKVTVAVAKKTV